MWYRNGRWVTAEKAREIRDAKLEEAKLKEEKRVAAELEAEKPVVEVKTTEVLGLEALRADYKDLYKKDVSNNKKNDAGWITKKIKEFTN